jgi:hypothetical protein
MTESSNNIVEIDVTDFKSVTLTKLTTNNNWDTYLGIYLDSTKVSYKDTYDLSSATTLKFTNTYSCSGAAFAYFKFNATFTML